VAIIPFTFSVATNNNYQLSPAARSYRHHAKSWYYADRKQYLSANNCFSGWRQLPDLHILSS